MQESRGDGSALLGPAWLARVASSCVAFQIQRHHRTVALGLTRRCTSVAAIRRRASLKRNINSVLLLWQDRTLCRRSYCVKGVACLLYIQGPERADLLGCRRVGHGASCSSPARSRKYPVGSAASHRPARHRRRLALYLSTRVRPIIRRWLNVRLNRGRWIDVQYLYA